MTKNQTYELACRPHEPCGTPELAVRSKYRQGRDLTVAVAQFFVPAHKTPWSPFWYDHQPHSEMTI